MLLPIMSKLALRMKCAPVGHEHGWHQMVYAISGVVIVTTPVRLVRHIS
ncbi:hypothetical protein [Pseudomonas putida]|nr:hypothetical protein [Pseudomonas putida]